MLSVAERDRLLSAYQSHVKRFDAIADERNRRAGVPSVTAQQVLPMPALQTTPAEALSARELDVLTLMSSGFGNREIGRQLVISTETVKSHIRKILMKLHARNRAQAAALAVHLGLVDLMPG